MHARVKSTVIEVRKPAVWLASTQPGTERPAGIWTIVWTALHDSRKNQAARLLRRHRDLIATHQGNPIRVAENSGIKDRSTTGKGSFTMVVTKRILFAAALAGFIAVHVLALQIVGEARHDPAPSPLMNAITGD